MILESPIMKKGITYQRAGQFEETRFEKIHNVVFENSKKGSLIVAQEIAELIKNKQSKNENCVLGLATGSSPIKVYEELVHMHKEEGLSFYNVITFNLDEYYPMEKDNIQSYHYFMHEHLFNHIDHKASILKETIEGAISSEVPATYLQEHDNTTFVLDTEAASELTRNKTPWLVGSPQWTEKLKSKAIVWLCEATQKTILSLTDKDYNDHGMSGLLAQEGSAYDINIDMFNKLQHTITGWPGGKPNADDTNRPERANPAKKRVVIFSPHPDDDVISMGGTFDRLVEQGHNVHVVYQTSGNIAVSDQEALKFAEIAYSLGAANAQKTLDDLQSKKENTIDTVEVRKLKGLIRRRESHAATRYIGLNDQNVHFLDLPFYETGTIKKNKLSQADIDLMCQIIKEIKPHQIYAAGDLADPHGTHKVCLDALFEALEQLKEQPYMKDCWVWLYRGAWHEWDTHEIEMAVPMSPDQVLKKRHAIFYHQSQKDGVMFQGEDSREFWMRAEERNRATAQKYNVLGLADYAAMEAFVRYNF